MTFDIMLWGMICERNKGQCQISGIVHYGGIFINNALELHKSCAEPSR